MLIEEINETIKSIRENLWYLDCLVTKLYNENNNLKNAVEDSTELIESAYRNGKRDGKEEMMNKIQEYFELKEKGAVNAQ